MAMGLSGFDAPLPEWREGGDRRDETRKIINYLIELRDFLEWRLNNLDTRNLNADKLPDISAGVVAPVAAQAQAALRSIGDLAALTTVAKTNLVAAINELDGSTVTQAEIDALTARVTALETQCAALRTDVTALGTQYTALDARVTALEEA